MGVRPEGDEPFDFACSFLTNHLMVRTLITSKGQTTVPIEIRRKWKGTEILWEACPDGTARVRPVPDVMALFGAPYNRFVPMFATNVLRVGATGFGLLLGLLTTLIVGTLPAWRGSDVDVNAVLRDGHRLGQYHKMLLPNNEVFDECRYFTPGAAPLVFEQNGVQVGVLICEDAWFDEPAAAACRLEKDGTMTVIVGTVDLTGSDTSSNALFAALQATAAQQIGVSDILLVAANTTGGVTGMRFKYEGDHVKTIAVCDATNQLLVAREDGVGKRTPFGDYRLIARGGTGVIAIDLPEDGSVNVAGALSVHDTDEVMLLTAKGQSIRTRVKEIRETGRGAKGVRLVTLEPGDRLLLCSDGLPRSVSSQVIGATMAADEPAAALVAAALAAGVRDNVTALVARV